MSIDPLSSSPVHGPGGAASRASRPAVSPGPAPKVDRLDLSDGLERLRRVHAAAADVPDVRADRVAALKSEIHSGSYRVNTDALAETLLDTSW